MTRAPETSPPVPGVMDEDVLAALRDAFIEAYNLSTCNTVTDYFAAPRLGHIQETLTRAGLSVVRTGTEFQQVDFYRLAAAFGVSIADGARDADDRDESGFLRLNSEVRKWQAKAAGLAEALRGMLSEWDKFTRYGSPIAKSANEPVAFALAALAAYDSSPPSPVDGWQKKAEVLAGGLRLASTHIVHAALAINGALDTFDSPPPPVRTQEESVVAREWAAFDGMMEEHAAALTGTHVDGDHAD